jgi:hypothetical protein
MSGDREFADKVVATLTADQVRVGMRIMSAPFTMLELWTALGKAGVEYWSLAAAWGLAWQERDLGRVECLDVRTGQWAPTTSASERIAA